MFLLLDNGTENTKIVLYGNNFRLLQSWKIINKEINSIEDFDTIIKQLLASENKSINKIDSAMIICIESNLKDIEKEFFIKNNINYVDIADKNIKNSIIEKYNLNSELQIDNLCNIVAGIKRFKDNFLIIDVDTKTTFTFINKNKTVVETIDTSNISLLKGILYKKSIFNKKFNLYDKNKLQLDNTINNIDKQIYGDYINLVNKCYKNIINKVNGIKTICLTGGISYIFADSFDFVDIVVPELILEGMMEIWKMNKRGNTKNV